MENIQKPTSLQIEECKQSIIDTINGLNMHATILEMVLKDIYLEVKQLADVTLAQEKQAYENALKQSKESEEQNAKGL